MRRLEFQTPAVTNINNSERFMAPNTPDSRSIIGKRSEVETSLEIDRKVSLNAQRTLREFEEIVHDTSKSAALFS